MLLEHSKVGHVVDAFTMLAEYESYDNIYKIKITGCLIDGISRYFYVYEE